MIKILAACGVGVNSSHQIKNALEEELSNRGYDVQCDIPARDDFPYR